MKIKTKSKSKKSQAELITTVLLILVSIAAVVVVSTFVINMVRDNLQNTDCFKTAGQIKINLEEDASYFTSETVGINTTYKTYISVARGPEKFNLSGITVTIGTAQDSTTYTIKAGTVTNVEMASGTTPGTIILPNPSETKTYIITTTASSVTKAKVVPILYPNKVCKEGSDEQNIPSK